MSWSKSLPSNPVVAVAGATGAVGQEFLKVLDDLKFPASRIIPLASAKSAGKKVMCGDTALTVEEMTPESFKGVDIALFSAGANVSRMFREAVVDAGAIMIDNSSAFRMEEDVPLVVPEVNPQDLEWHSGVIANPNCSTIMMVVALAALEKVAPIKRVVTSTYQAASGAGAPAMQELYDQTRAYLAGEPFEPHAFTDQIAFNVIPHIDVFLEDASTKEEWKMIVETRKIMGHPDMKVAANCARVPVLRSHSEYINVEFEAPITPEQAREALSAGESLVVNDDPAHNGYPMPALLAGTNDVYVGRIRKDFSVDYGISFWCVMDQIRKGAALNAVQIAQRLLG